MLTPVLGRSEKRQTFVSMERLVFLGKVFRILVPAMTVHAAKAPIQYENDFGVLMGVLFREGNVGEVAKQCHHTEISQLSTMYSMTAQAILVVKSVAESSAKDMGLAEDEMPGYMACRGLGPVQPFKGFVFKGCCRCDVTHLDPHERQLLAFSPMPKQAMVGLWVAVSQRTCVQCGKTLIVQARYLHVHPRMVSVRQRQVTKLDATTTSSMQHLWWRVMLACQVSLFV